MISSPRGAAPKDLPAATVRRLRTHLVGVRLAGDVATSPGNTRANCGRLADGHPDYTFGLSGWETTSRQEIRDAVATVCGDRAVDRPADADGWIDPETTIGGIAHHRVRLAELARAGGRALLATGHPTGLLAHYMTVGRALSATGCALLTPLDDTGDLVRHGDHKLGVRFLDGVACAFAGGDLVHTHRSALCEAMLDAAEAAGQRPDLVVADHGMAGAAIEREIATLSIADVNDPALILAAVRGRTDGLLVIDDNLAPRLYKPVTEAVLTGVPASSPG